MSGPILIVDDNPTIRQLLIDALDASGFATVEAADGQEGVAMALLCHPSLILLDLNLPVATGFAFVDAIKEHGIDAPILLVTADPRAEQVALDQQVVGYLRKPFDLETLLDTVARLVEGSSVAGVSSSP